MRYLAVVAAFLWGFGKGEHGTLAAAPHRDWKTAILTETRTPDSAVLLQAFTFDLGDKMLVCSGEYLWRMKPVQAEVGSQIRYVRNGSHLIFLDSKGKEQKCSIQREVAK